MSARLILFWLAVVIMIVSFTKRIPEPINKTMFLIAAVALLSYLHLSGIIGVVMAI